MKEHERLLKKRWWLLAVICLINLCLGSIYAWSVCLQLPLNGSHKRRELF